MTGKPNNMVELTTSMRRLVRSLASAKHRREHGLFTVEGVKCVRDTAVYFDCVALFATSSWIDANNNIIAEVAPEELYQVKNSDLERMTSLSTPPSVIALCRIPEPSLFDFHAHESELIVALDRIQDPGNLGTIVRLCDWFGITTILASEDTVDIWSTKAVQASMGAVSRVSVIYCNLDYTLKNSPTPVYGTFLDSPSIYDTKLPDSGIVVFGNEGQGISTEIASIVTNRITIPTFPPDRRGSESLNVAMAAAVTLSEFRRRRLCINPSFND